MIMEAAGRKIKTRHEKLGVKMRNDSSLVLVLGPVKMKKAELRNV